MKTKFCFYLQPNYPHPRTAIEAEILFAAHIMHLWFLKRPSGKTPREQNSSGEKIGAVWCSGADRRSFEASAVLHFVFFGVMVNKMQQSAKRKVFLKKNTLPEVFPLTAILAGSGKTMPFEKRRSRYKETAENKAEAYLVYVEHLFSAYDAVDARIFSKGDGETIIYTYDKGGQLKGVSGVKNTVKGTENYSYIDTIVYDEHGQRVYIKYGNGVETKYRYDDKRRWLKDIETKNRQTDEIFQKISYRFDKVGNVLGYSNDASVYETSQNYTYGSLYQLIGVEGTSNQYKAIKSFGSTPVNVAKYKQDFAFDGIGNMTRKASTTNLPGARGNAYPKAELDYSLDYEYDPAYAHRLVHAGNRYYCYDANGNITAEKDGPFTEDDEFIFTYSYDPDTDVYGTDYGFGLDAPKETEETHPENLFAYRRNYTWNEKNLLTKSSDRTYTVHYRYGEDGQRALKYTEEGRSETLYFNNFYTIHIPVQDKNNPQGLRVHKHIFVGNSRLVTAMTHTDNNGDNAEQREKRYYYHSDHLGSAQFVTDWRGRQYEHIEYTPYGELWIEEVAAGLDKLPFRFTGKEMDEETGLYYYGARYLDPKYSRWLSGDPALSDYIPKAPVDDEAKKHNENLPGMGGVFNVVNLHLYHYAGNNPIKYEDPDGRSADPAEIWESVEDVISDPMISTAGYGLNSIISGFAIILFVFSLQGDAIKSPLPPNYSISNEGQIKAPNGTLIATIEQAYMHYHGYSNWADVKKWSAGSFDTPNDSLLYHFNKHGAEVKAKSAEDYYKKALNFAANLKGAKSAPVAGVTENVTRYKKMENILTLMLREILFHLEQWSSQMALVHNFFVIPSLQDVTNKINNQLDLKCMSKRYKHISIHDDIIIFIFKTLKWFKSENNTKTKTTKGLFYYGISLIESDNLNTFLRIVVLWKELFKLAPETDVIPESSYGKKEIISQIENLIRLLEYATKNNKVILHFGI